MSSFTLRVNLREEECDTVTEWINSVAATDDARSQMVLVDSESVSLFMSQGGTESTAHVAILVPPAMRRGLEAETDSVTGNEPQLRMVQKGIQSSTILNQVHTLLGQDKQCRIRGLFQGKAADVLLIDVSHCYGGWLEEMARKISGQAMLAYPTAVISLVPISFIVTSQQQLQTGYEIPSCPVCLHRIYPPRLGMPKPRNDQLCSGYCNVMEDELLRNSIGGCQNEVFLRPWPLPSDCKACRMIFQQWKNHNQTGGRSRNELDDVFCNRCALQETLWICLTCGFVGCGRYSQAHSLEHFSDSKHAFALEMATLRIWDYASGEFAHRGDLLECPSIRRRHPPHHQWANVALPWEEDKKLIIPSKYASLSPSDDEPSQKKAAMIGEEYEALLQSALEDQAQHYEGEISHLNAALTAERVDSTTMTASEQQEILVLQQEIEQLRRDLDVVSRNLLDIQAQEAGHRAASQRLLREQTIAQDLLEKIRAESEREHQQGKQQVEELEQQVADLSANLSMRYQISQDEELNEAQIYGAVTTSSPAKQMKRGNKKSRRFFRK